MTVARIALPVPASGCFDYWVPGGMEVTPGTLVRVRLKSRRMTGVVVEVAASSEVPRERLQSIDEVVDMLPVPLDVCELAGFVADYYQSSLGQVLSLAVPSLSKSRVRNAGAASAATAAPHALNPAQAEAVEAIAAASGFAPMLLQGVTGSGKTDVYLAAAARAIAAGGQVLILVPEINLTPQLVSRARSALPGAVVAVLHSALAAGQRRNNWELANRGAADVALGTRLAVFAPLPRLALVIVDEEQDPSYKQQDTVRYHARDVAVLRAHRKRIPVVLGSATPSLESYAHAGSGRYRKLVLPQRADPAAQLPSIRLVPERSDAAIEGLSPQLQAALALRLERGEQSLLFVNRRGFAPSLKCSACNWEAACPRCTARLTLHRVPPRLMCHHCGHAERVARACPSCGNVDLVPRGRGTQRLEAALASLYPGARIARVDRDSTRRKAAFETIRDQVAARELDILVGTQMLAKGHDFPRLTLVGVLGADNALYSADFRAVERLAQLLFQVAGRAGRAALPGEVLIQTAFPDHPMFRCLVAHDYDGFAQGLLEERQLHGLPPYRFLVLLAAEAHRRADVDAFLQAAHARAVEIARRGRDKVEVFSPVEAPMARRAGFERAQMLLRSDQRGALHELVTELRAGLESPGNPRVRWTLDVDPSGLA